MSAFPVFLQFSFWNCGIFCYHIFLQEILSTHTILLCHINTILPCHINTTLPCHIITTLPCHIDTTLLCHINTTLPCHNNTILPCHINTTLLCHINTIEHKNRKTSGVRKPGPCLGQAQNVTGINR